MLINSVLKVVKDKSINTSNFKLIAIVNNLGNRKVK